MASLAKQQESVGMAHQSIKSQAARVEWARPGAPRRGSRREAARVVVAWSSQPNTEVGRCLAPVNLELEASSSAEAGWTWRCRELAGASWVDVISAARCSEVVLTACLGDDRRARHLVLELAEQLTQRLSATKPYIRVRFLPTPPQLATSRGQSA